MTDKKKGTTPKVFSTTLTQKNGLEVTYCPSSNMWTHGDDGYGSMYGVIQAITWGDDDPDVSDSDIIALVRLYDEAHA